MPTAKTQIAKKESTALTTTGYAEMAGAGFEGVDPSHFSPPFINILQSLSATVKSKQNSDGDIYNTSSCEATPGADGITIIPCAVKHGYVEWRENRGGFVAEHPVSSSVVQKALANPVMEPGKKFPTFKNGNNVLQETFTLYGLLDRGDGVLDQVIIPFTSTKITAYRHFMSTAIGPKLRTENGELKPYPLCAHRYKFTTKADKRASGDSFNWSIKFDGANADEARLSPESVEFQAAIEFNEIVKRGNVKEDYAKSQDTGKASEQEDDGSIPF